jgi:uncharacterized membrane protein YdcZ (DUF606 family)
MSLDHNIPRSSAYRLARRAFYSFLLIFLILRGIAYLIMSKQIPNFYLSLEGTPFYHLNYGIFLLALVGGYALLCRPVGLAANLAALLYGLAMALTFDQFGMWLHFSGGYWQRVSVDAIIVILALSTLVLLGRSIERFESRHFWVFVFLLLALCGFGFAVFVAGDQIGHVSGPKLLELELLSSP